MKVLSIYKKKFVIIITDVKAHLYPSFILLRNHSIFSINWNVENDDSTKGQEKGKLLWPDVVIWNAITPSHTHLSNMIWGQLSGYNM